MLVRAQMNVPATGEILAPFATAHFVAGGMRGSHNMPLMPVPLGTGTSYFDGPPLVTCAGFCVRDGKLTEAVDNFAHPFWNTVRDSAAKKSLDMRRQGFFGAAMLPMAELEYTGIVEKINALDARFHVRSPKPKSAAA
jgi:fructose 1,6-bisphosphate aldolase/phosphatase